MPWLTPDAPPPDDFFCRRLSIPNDPTFIQAVNGALTQLIYPHNWELFGSMPPEEAAQLMQLMVLEYFDAIGCDPELQPPYYSDPDDVDGEDSESPQYNLPPSPWYDQIADWVIAGFLAVTFTPAAGFVYITTIPRIRLAFRTGSAGVIVRVLLDSVEVWTGDTYEPIRDFLDVILPLEELAAAHDLGPGPWEIRVEHSGEANPAATPIMVAGVPRYQLEAVRGDIRAPALENVYIDEPPSWAELSADYLEAFGVELVPPLALMLDGCNLQLTLDGEPLGEAIDLTTCEALIGPPGPEGPPGAASTVPGPPGADGEDGADSTVPGPAGETGATGAASTVPGPTGPAGDDCDCSPVPPQPTVVADVDRDQQACNIASGLGEWLWGRFDDSLAIVVAGVEAAQAVETIASGLIDAIPVLGAIVDAVMDFATETIQAGAEETDAANTNEFREMIQCEFYCILKETTGDFTPELLNTARESLQAWGLALPPQTPLLVVIGQVFAVWLGTVPTQELLRRANIYQGNVRDCDLCDCGDEDGVWCYEWDDTTIAADWSLQAGGQNTRAVFFDAGFGESRTITRIRFEYTWNGIGDSGSRARAIWGGENETDLLQISTASISPLSYEWNGSQSMTGITLGVNADTGSGALYIVKIVIEGDGVNPYGEDNCT